jgi:hypothetical protein
LSLDQNNLDFLQYQASKNSFVWKFLSGFLSLSRTFKRLFLGKSGNVKIVETLASENFAIDFSKRGDGEFLPQAWLPYPELRKIWFSQNEHLVGRKIILVSSDAFIAGQGYGGYTTSLLLGGYLASKEKASLEIWNLVDDSSVSKIRNFIKENLAIDLKNITMKNVNSESIKSRRDESMVAKKYKLRLSLVEATLLYTILMANIYSHLNTHVVFAVKGRENILPSKMRPELFKYIS